jgi:hypothetical protein
MNRAAKMGFFRGHRNQKKPGKEKLDKKKPAGFCPAGFLWLVICYLLADVNHLVEHAFANVIEKRHQVAR